MKLFDAKTAAGLLAMQQIGAISSPEEYVNILGGTSSRQDLSTGNTLPLVARPWGFNSWAPMTENDPTYSSWWFHPNDRRYFGLRCTHQPSPWIGDYGQFRIVASLNSPQHSGSGQFSGYKPSDSAWKPYYFNATLLAYGTAKSFTSLEFAPSSHGGIMRVTFPEYEEGTNFIQTRRIAIALNGAGDTSSITTSEVDGSPSIVGKVKENSGGEGANFGHYFAAQVYGGVNGDEIVAPMDSGSGDVLPFLDFDPQDARTQYLTVRVATSLISAEQALVNLQSEVSSKVSFDDMLRSAKGEWNDVLSRVDIKEFDDSYGVAEKEKLLSVFYTNLYRASLFPRQLSEVDKDGQTVHYSPYDSEGGVFPGPLTSDSGFWDAYITMYPYLSLVNRESLGVMLQGWVNAYQEGEWLPKWASPGYRGSMVGTMGDVTLADAIVKKIPGFDQQKAYEAIRKDAFELPPTNRSGVGRVCLEDYLKYGYVPRDGSTTESGTCDQVVSRSLNYMQSDYAIAQAALVLNHPEDAGVLMSRANNYSLMFDGAESGGFMRSRVKETAITDGGKWTEGFDEFAWGGDYTEAGPWQLRFYVPYDPKGLAALYRDEAGVDMCDVLESMQTMPGVFHLGGYSTEIHEQLELSENCWGQYAHNNQPSHHILYMYNGMDTEGVRGSCASKGQYWLRKAQRELYNLRPAMYAGDDDNGEMAAWYILSSLGLFSLSPGSPEMIFGSPLFQEVDVHIDPANDAVLTVRAINNSAENVYVHAVSWNGVDVSSQNGIDYAELVKGGVLEFTMGAEPFSAAK